MGLHDPFNDLTNEHSRPGHWATFLVFAERVETPNARVQPSREAGETQSRAHQQSLQIAACPFGTNAAPCRRLSDPFSDRG